MHHAWVTALLTNQFSKNDSNRYISTIISGPTRCLNHDSINEGSTTNSSSGTSMPTVPQTTSVAAKLLFKSSLANPRQHLGILNLKVSQLTFILFLNTMHSVCVFRNSIY